jgi:TldD protein
MEKSDGSRGASAGNAHPTPDGSGGTPRGGVDPLRVQAMTPRLLDVMAREMTRSLEGLRVPGNPRPYFMAYALRRVHAAELRAAYGSLVRERTTTKGQLYVEVRVGSHRFDNVIDGGLGQDADDRESVEWMDAPHDLDETALAVALWKLTQLKFDEALADYYDHKKAMVSEYLRDEVDAFSKEPALHHVEPLTEAPFPVSTWSAVLVDLSRRFLERPDVYDPAITMHAERVQRWFVNSDGTRVVTEDVYVDVEVNGWILTDDGVYVEASRQIFRRDVAQVPGHDEIARALDEVLAELSALRHAKSPGSFIGPALLSGQSAATMFHEALGHRLEGQRLVARGETRTFAHRIGDRILPVDLDIVDDPSRTHHEDEPLFGSYRVDDEGVPAQPAVLVERGVLRSFLTSRSPAPGVPQSNGHGRHDGVQFPMARMGNLIVRGDPTQAKEWPVLFEQLRTIAKAQGRSHGVYIRRIHAGETTTSAYDFQVFKGELAEVFLVDVETGALERIRDVELIGTPLAALQRIVAFGGPSETDQGFCYAESGAVPVSGISPAILLTEVELQQKSVTAFHEPLLPPPFADDGTRGRSGRLRQRGKRRRTARAEADTEPSVGLPATDNPDETAALTEIPVLPSAGDTQDAA